MEKGKIEFNDPTFREHPQKGLKPLSVAEKREQVRKGNPTLVRYRNPTMSTQKPDAVELCPDCRHPMNCHHDGRGVWGKGCNQPLAMEFQCPCQNTPQTFTALERLSAERDKYRDACERLIAHYGNADKWLPIVDGRITTDIYACEGNGYDFARQVKAEIKGESK